MRTMPDMKETADPMTELRAIEELDTLDGFDPEEAHTDAESILLAFLRHAGYTRVADAFEAANDRVGFWYA